MRFERERAKLFLPGTAGGKLFHQTFQISIIKVPWECLLLLFRGCTPCRFHWDSSSSSVSHYYHSPPLRVAVLKFRVQVTWSCVPRSEWRASRVPSLPFSISYTAFTTFLLVRLSHRYLSTDCEMGDAWVAEVSVASVATCNGGV